MRFRLAGVQDLGVDSIGSEVGEHRTLGGFYPLVYGEKVISGDEEGPGQWWNTDQRTYDRSA